MRTLALCGLLLLSALGGCRSTPIVEQSEIEVANAPTVAQGGPVLVVTPAPQGATQAPIPIRPSPQLAAQAVEPTPRFEPLSQAGNQSPYRVGGQTYTLLASTDGYVERGQASWYGPNFHGKQTSNLEVYDMHKLTAAHKTLPLPSYVHVTNLDNNKQVIVRVNDRGPFKPGRIIDLSYAAAAKLGLIDQGIGNVEVRAINAPGASERPAVTNADNIYLQLGAFGSRDNAMNALRRVPYEGAHVSSADVNGATLHRLRIGPLDSAELADQLKAKVAAEGFGDSRVIFE